MTATQECYAVAINEAARLLGLGRTSIYTLLKQGELETVVLCGRRLVLMDSIKAAVERAKAEGSKSLRKTSPEAQSEASENRAA
ncbi:helix-turn-helix domain-containing protein [Methylocystis sp. H62]|uniref:helix-turn-helix domain-containing protein n=1 Tax=Methylocystis sp. H62 TaxID=2785789 RepID=UPI0018C1F310|nr:helix-turn-helix domain-containing protein [Methylocystis sp. H62]MBG0795063.1 helix-turn-helix domain-containing protein [Methylocystis sp. H62]